MCLIVCVDDFGVVDSKQYWQFLDSYIVDYLIVGLLQEGGVDCYYWFVVVNCQFGGEGDCMLFGNGDVKVLIGEFF